jgi:hypothetical protein
MRDWLVVNVPEMGMGYGVLISCTDVGSTPGEFKYFIEGVKDGKVVAFLRQQRSAAPGRHQSQIEGEPPSLPARSPRPPATTKPARRGCRAAARTSAGSAAPTRTAARGWSASMACARSRR